MSRMGIIMLAAVALAACQPWDSELDTAAIRSAEAQTLVQYLIATDVLQTIVQVDPLAQYAPPGPPALGEFLAGQGPARNLADEFSLAWAQTGYTAGTSALGTYGAGMDPLDIAVTILPDAYSFVYTYRSMPTYRIIDTGASGFGDPQELFGQYEVTGSIQVTRHSITGTGIPECSHSGEVAGDVTLVGGRITRLEFDITYTSTHTPDGSGTVSGSHNLDAAGYLTSYFADGMVLQNTF